MVPVRKDKRPAYDRTKVFRVDAYPAGICVFGVLWPTGFDVLGWLKQEAERARSIAENLENFAKHLTLQSNRRIKSNQTGAVS